MLFTAQELWEANEILGNAVSHSIQLQRETPYDRKLLRLNRVQEKLMKNKVLLRANKNNKLGKRKKSKKKKLYEFPKTRDCGKMEEVKGKA